jgi:dimethylaniline monooxygenase (N-oxide forming)
MQKVSSLTSTHRPHEFEGKTVVVVGIANTGCDIAVELCGVAKKVYLSHRSGTHVVSRRLSCR